MPDIEWVDDVPLRFVKPTAQRYREFAEALQANPGKWAIFPYEGKTDPPYVATNIRYGKYKAFPAKQFQAATRAGVVYVRYVGEAS